MVWLASWAVFMAAGTPVFSASPGQGVTVQSDDDAYALTLKSRVQLRDTITHTPSAGLWASTNDPQVKTLRLVLSGHVLDEDLGYTVQLAFGAGDFEPGNASPIFDAFVEYRGFRDAQVRVGQFFVPFDRARTIREFALQFVDRQQVVRELSLDRDVGVMLSSKDLFGLDGRLGYAAFVGGGEGRNRVNGGTLLPLVVLRGVGRTGAFDDDQESYLTRGDALRAAVGVAVAFNAQSSRLQSTLGETYAAGATDQVNGAVDVVVKWRGVSLLAEGLVRQALQDEVSGVVDGVKVTTPTRSGAGWFAQAGCLLNPFVEVVGRYEELYALPGTDPAFVDEVERSGRQVAAGANLYLNGHAFKLQLDSAVAFGAAGVSRQVIRAQLDATF